MRSLVLFALPLSLSGGCAPQDAPTELNSLSRYLFREWNDSDPQPMQAGVATLEKELLKVDLDGSVDDRSFKVSPLDKSDLVDVIWPMDRDPHKAIGACLVRRSKWDMDDQARFIISPDQIEAEPTAKSYMRSFVDPTDPSCFVGQGCPVLYTDNTITRDTQVITVTYLLHKNLRWVTLDDDRWAIAARSFSDRSWPGQKSGTAVQQSYSIDIFLGQPDGRALRYQCSWAETDLTVSVDDGLALAVLVQSVDNAMADTDDVIGKRFHAM